MIVWVFLHYFHSKAFTFSDSLYEQVVGFLPELTFLACFIVLGDLWEVLLCSIKTDFMFSIFEFSIVLWLSSSL